jgi:hypothetical protein
MRNELMSSRSGYAFYRDVFGDWRWEYYDRNGEAIDSRDAFETREECVEDAQLAGLGGTILTLAPKQAHEPRRGTNDENRAERPNVEEQTRRAA